MMAWSDPESDPPPQRDYQPVTPAQWDRLFAHVMWMEPKPRWRPRWGRLAVAVLVSCGLWAAILVPLILWG